jgi:hypothetical protein
MEMISWSWRVRVAVPPTDLDQRGFDDRSLAIHLVFAAAKHRGIRNGRPSGHVITYIWGGKGARGDRYANPYFGKQSIQIILQGANAPLGRNLLEDINFANDYRSAFGDEPLPLYMIGISADSDDTKTTSRGEIRNLCFAGASNIHEGKSS